MKTSNSDLKVHPSSSNIQSREGTKGLLDCPDALVDKDFLPAFTGTNVYWAIHPLEFLYPKDKKD